MATEKYIKLFEHKQVRTHWNDEQEKWYFSVQDVVKILSESRDVKQYIKRMRQRNIELAANWGTICTLLSMKTADGKMRKIQASDTEGILRIIQSIPSKKENLLSKVARNQLEKNTGKNVVTKLNANNFLEKKTDNKKI